MSGDLTRPMRTPCPSGVARRRRRWPLALLAVVAVVLALLVAADRAAAAYAGRQVAQQMRSHGFPATPDVTIEGFPFLTQVITRNVHDVHITASGLREGPVTASLVADATGVRLSPGYRSGVITSAKGTVLIGFGSVAGVVRKAGIPGVTASAAGPHRIRFKADLGFVTADVIASIAQTGPRTFGLHIISAGGLPASVLGSFGNVAFQVPPLPYGITVRGITVTRSGVAGHLTARNVYFTR